ncbi:MAG: universal stress protein [Emcibacter sp.]|nr:universal stress protein [Emcibacter sp.]
MSKEKKAFHNILVVIDPAKETQYALKRALKMNELLDGGVNIHLFISFEMDELNKTQNKFEFVCDHNWFGELVKPLVDDGIEYSAEVFWTADWHQSILKCVRRHDVDLIVMSDYTTGTNHNDLSAAKWSLLRVSDCPVLIVHPEAKMERQTILAAVNMQTDNPRYVELNEKILKMTRLMAGTYGAEKHIVNAYEDSMQFPDRAKLLRDTDSKQENTHVQQGNPVNIISEVADNINADVVVIGTLSRRGIMAAMRGNKSEEIIRKLNRDVMVLN